MNYNNGNVKHNQDNAMSGTITHEIHDDIQTLEGVLVQLLTGQLV